MNLIADECVPRQVVERLIADGHSVEWITRSAPGISDVSLLDRSADAAAPLLTIDTDFGELVFRAGQATAGVCLLRLEGISNSLKAGLVSQFIPDHGSELAGMFFVVTPGGTRSR